MSGYDADGRPVLRDELTAGGVVTKTLLVDQLFEVDVTPNGANAGATTSYYFFGGQRVAQREQTTGSAPTLRFRHGDHLGSQALVTDASGNEVSRLSYLPYGGTRLGSQPGAFGFTDQRLERQHGLHYYGNHSGYGRFYDSGIGVWTQPDIQVPGASAVDWNRFAYVRANPLRYLDPTGHACVESGGVNFGDCWAEFRQLVEAGVRQVEDFQDWLREQASRVSRPNGNGDARGGPPEPCKLSAGSFCLGPGQMVVDPVTGKVRWQPGGFDPDLASEGLTGGVRAAKGSLRRGAETVGQAIARHADHNSVLKRIMARIMGPDGDIIGRVGDTGNPQIRVLKGDDAVAFGLYNDLVVLAGNGTTRVQPNGTWITTFSDGITITFRNKSNSGGPAVAITLPGVKGEAMKWHFE